MVEASSNVTGADGELVERLCQALGRMNERNPDWLTTALATLSVELGVAFLSTQKTFNATESYTLLKNRIAFLARQRVLESFVVLAAREAVSLSLRAASDTRGVNERREQMRRFWSDLWSDPDRFRDFFRRMDPDSEQANWPDDRIRQESHELMGLFEPLQVDRVADIWEMASYWFEVTTELLPNVILDQWRRLKLARMLGHDPS